MPKRPRVPARYYALLCDSLQDAGVDVDRVLAGADLRRTALDQMKAALTIPQIDGLVAQALLVAGRDDIGFDWGRRIKISAHEIVGYALLTSPTFGYCLRIASHYHRLIMPTFRMSVRPLEGHVEIRFTPVFPLAPETLLVHLEALSISLHEQMKWQLGDTMPPYDIYLSCRQPAHFRRFRDLKPARWHFEVPQPAGFRAILDAATMDHPLPMADRAALQMAEAQCDALLERITRAGGVGDWVTMMLREARDDMPTSQELAHILHITRRTLDRRLRSEGHRFLDLAKRVRHERACELLRDGQSVTEVSLQLGYRDVANFTRAFKRDAGMSPSEFAAGRRKR